MSLLITPATAPDAPAITALLTRAFARLSSHYPADILAPLMPYFGTCQPALIASGRYFALREDGVIRAVGGWSEGAPGTGAVVPGTGHIRHVGVDPDAGGKGFGRALLSAIEADAAANGIARLEAFANRPAIPFYRALGYVEIGARTDMIAGKYPFEGMDLAKSLSGPARSLRPVP